MLSRRGSGVTGHKVTRKQSGQSCLISVLPGSDGSPRAEIVQLNDLRGAGETGRCCVPDSPGLAAQPVSHGGIANRRS
jgi:hypothetical protein